MASDSLAPSALNTSSFNFALRLAHEDDAQELEALIELSVRCLLSRHYTTQQLAVALGPVFGLDRRLIADCTYFVVESGDGILACGGWSKRRAVYGGDRSRAGEDTELSPAVDAARIRAFFVHPNWERRGLGRLLLRASEEAISAAGFSRIELVATLAGEPLYATHGYVVVERYDALLPDGSPLAVARMTKLLSGE